MPPHPTAKLLILKHLEIPLQPACHLGWLSEGPRRWEGGRGEGLPYNFLFSQNP